MTSWELPEIFETPYGTVRWGSWGHGAPLVLLHGTPFSAKVWHNIAPELAEDYRVFVWDMLGYGQSEMRTGQDVSLRVQAEIFTSLLESWNLSAPTLIAHDYGGTVALRAHLLHGVRCARLVLLDPVALAPWGSEFFRLVRDNAEVFERLPSHLHRALVREYVDSASSVRLTAAALERLTAPWLGEIGQSAFYRQIAQADQRYTDEIQHDYDSITMPVLVCWGTEDAWIPVAKSHELTSMIPDAELRLIAGAGHLVQEDAPTQLLSTLRDYLSSTPGQNTVRSA